MQAKIRWKHNIENLLNDELQSFYWIGFILADGHIDNSARLRILLSDKDKEHLYKLKTYINSAHPIHQRTIRNKNNLCELSISAKKSISKICDKFLIHQRKTYNPPDFSKYNFTDKQMLSLIIGFIDGDGCINKKAEIQLVIHATWKENLKYIKNHISKFLNIKIKNDIYHPKYNSNTVVFRITKYATNKKLLEFSRNNNLPILDRKWNIIQNKINNFL